MLKADFLHFQESSAEWTSVGTRKKYECKDKTEDGRHTMHFEADRSKSEFSMYCREDGGFEFEDLRENWPTCLVDILCDELPPEIPTHSEYIEQKVRDR